jgi:hypothetical protein
VTGKADFTEDEWKTVLEGPPSAGLMVSTAQRGGTFREAFSIAKTYTEARQQHGESQLLDEITAAKPQIDRSRQHSLEERRTHSLQQLREAMGVLETKATPEELDDYRAFVISVAERVAGAKTEGDQPASDAEQAAIDEIRTTLGAQ